MVIASNNNGKIREIKEILEIDDIFSLSDKNIKADVVEDGETFLDNAIKKAKEIYKLCDETVIADDSGLCINSLNGFPGVNTHRFLGEDATDEDRNNDLLKRLENYTDRSAKIICSIVYFDGNKVIEGRGVITGNISFKRRGSNGFGFDDIFEISNGKTLAELTPTEKNEISARAIALHDLKNKLKKENII